jgi:hypothetical protein
VWLGCVQATIEPFGMVDEPVQRPGVGPLCQPET